MFSEEHDPSPARGAEEQSRMPVKDAEGWSYLPFELNEETKEHHITLERDEDGERVEFTLPSFVEQGDELGKIALLVIQARERWAALKGLGA